MRFIQGLFLASTGDRLGTVLRGRGAWKVKLMLMRMSNIKVFSVNSGQCCHCMLDIFILIIGIIRLYMSDWKLCRIYSQAMNKVKCGFDDLFEIYINLSGGELAFRPRHGFWLEDWLVKFEFGSLIFSGNSILCLELTVFIALTLF